MTQQAAGLVEARREGTRALHSITPEGFAPVAAFVESFWRGKPVALKREVEGKLRPKSTSSVQNPPARAT